jgi:hypothetical protein
MLFHNRYAGHEIRRFYATEMFIKPLKPKLV